MTKEEQQAEMRKRLEQQLSEKRMRVFRLADMIAMRPENRKPEILEGIAIELRSLAYQIRFVEKAIDALDLAD